MLPNKWGDILTINFACASVVEITRFLPQSWTFELHTCLSFIDSFFFFSFYSSFLSFPFQDRSCMHDQITDASNWIYRTFFCFWAVQISLVLKPNLTIDNIYWPEATAATWHLRNYQHLDRGPQFYPPT